MKKDDITKLKDKDLQLKYILGGLKFIRDGNIRCNYWTCDINCSCNKVEEDEKFIKIKKFIKKHNLTNERFAKLTYNYLVGAIMKYNGSYTPLFTELYEVIKTYNFPASKKYKIEDIGYKEKEFEEYLYGHNNDLITDYINKYSLTREDVMALIKTYVNGGMYGLQLINNEDKFLVELKDIIHKSNIDTSNYNEYKKTYQINKENTELIINTKSIQK